MAIIKCKMCGGDLDISEGLTVCECEYCGTKQTVPTVDDERKITLFNRAGRLLRSCEFDKAAGVFESIVADFPEEAEAYWGLVLCKFGIEYVDDPATGKKVPTCHRSGFDSVMEDADFEQACENADAIARRQYREEAKAIEELRRGIIEVSGKEEPYDIFICYKETDENGGRTVDSVIAQDVYDALTAKGYRVFFSRITLEDKLGQEYEPYIFAALNSAKIMLAFGTDFEYFNAVWVKNEWSRFLKLMEKDKSKHLIPCYKGIDAYDMPKEFARLQAQDMGKVGAVQDLLRGIEKLLPRKEEHQPQAVVQQVVQTAGGPNVTALLQRGNMALEDGEWDGAREYFDKVLNMNAECGEAYLGLLMATAQCSNRQALSAAYTRPEANLDNDKNAIRAKRFGDKAIKDWFDELEKTLQTNRAEKAEQERIAREERAEKERLAALLKKETEERQRKAEAEQKQKEAEERDAIIDALKLGSQAGEVSLEDQLAAARRKAERIEHVCKTWDELAEEIASHEKNLEDLRKNEQELRNRRGALGIFAGKEKRMIDGELGEVAAEIKEEEEWLEEKKKGRAGFDSKADAERSLRIMQEEAHRLEEKMREPGPAYTFKSAVQALIGDEKMLRAVYAKDSKLVEGAGKKSVTLAVCLAAAKLVPTVTFGRYDYGSLGGEAPIEWRVLKKQGNRALLISKYNLDYIQYSQKVRTDVVWATSYLRTWLNKDFYTRAFEKREQERILLSGVSQDRDPDELAFSPDPGPVTQDKVFLLSDNEAKAYFASDEKRKSKGTPYASGKYRPIAGSALKDSWWLRSPGYDGQHVSYVDAYGHVNTTGYLATFVNVSVRPAIWIDLNER